MNQNVASKTTHPTHRDSALEPQTSDIASECNEQVQAGHAHVFSPSGPLERDGAVQPRL